MGDLAGGGCAAVAAITRSVPKPLIGQSPLPPTPPTAIGGRKKTSQIIFFLENGPTSPHKKYEEKKDEKYGRIFIKPLNNKIVKIIK